MIADAVRETDRRVERQRRLNDIRYAYDRLRAATDWALHELELLNLAGTSVVPGHLRERIRRDLDELPAGVRGALREGSVQETLDSIFDVQDRLFRWRHPWRELVDEEEGSGGD